MTTRRTALRQLAAGAATLAAPAFAQEDKSPISIVVGVGGSVDATARLFAEHLSKLMGRQVLVVPKTGAGQRLALNEVRRAAPDGRTLAFVTSGTFAIYPNIYTNLDYGLADFTPVSGVCSFDVGIAASLDTGVTTLRQMVDWARARGDTPYGSPGTGSLPNFVGIYLGLDTGLKLTQVPYRDTNQIVVDLVAGRVPMVINGANSLTEMHKAGKIRVLAVSGEARLQSLPDVPTMKESGFAFSASTSTDLYGPRGLPPDYVRRIHEGVKSFLASPGTVEKLAGQVMTPRLATPTELAAALTRESKHYAQLVEASGYVREKI